MDPKFAAVVGPRQGSVIPLGKGRTSVGRDATNEICLQSMWVSRHHCVVDRQAEGLTLIDLGSHNGTFVNGVPVKERALEHGDEVRIGDSVFLVLLREIEPAAPGTPVELKEKGMVAGATIELSATRSAPPTTESEGRAARDLVVLLRIGTAIGSIRDVETLRSRLLESLFEVIPAERGALLLAGRGTDDIAGTFGLEKKTGPVPGIAVSRTIVLRVLRERVSILCNDVRDSDDFREAHSLASANVHSVLAVPLVSGERPLGVLYLDTSQPKDRFDRGHLELLTAIAGIASMALENARQIEWLEGENRRLRQDADLAHDMVGESPAMRAVLAFVSKVAPTDSTVLITGESGTGKELVARALHHNSPRAHGPFVAVNCAALAETLLESEMFGHERGAFTGAVAQKKGKIEVAEGGTLFLDEVGEIAPHLQSKLLRVLQEHVFERVGGTRPIQADVRLITATNKDLRELTKTGGFRDDLFYRINVVAIDVPPLRDRREDIPLLARYFAAKCAERCNRRVSGISIEALEALMEYDWPGNVRELENAVERAVVLGSGDTIRLEDLPECVLETGPAGPGNATRYHEVILRTKKDLILNAFKEAGGSYVETAKILDVHPNYLHRLIRNMDLKGSLRK
jgi:Nif-specific regulatory protein